VQFKVRRRQDPVIEIAPLIDVVFLLLLFFMVTTQFVSLPGLKLTLPGVRQGATATATSRIDVQITAGHDVYVGGNPVALDHLPGVLKKSTPDPSSAVVVLMADERTPHGTVVSIMDAIQRRG
jgi:biopolymer transport protein ExbD